MLLCSKVVWEFEKMLLLQKISEFHFCSIFKQYYFLRSRICVLEWRKDILRNIRVFKQCSYQELFTKCYKFSYFTKMLVHFRKCSLFAKKCAVFFVNLRYDCKFETMFVFSKNIQNYRKCLVFQKKKHLACWKNVPVYYFVPKFKKCGLVYKKMFYFSKVNENL